MTADLDNAEATPLLVQICATLSADDEDWTTLPFAVARKLRLLAAPAFGSADLDLHWGQINDPDDPEATPETDPPLDVDDLVRLVPTTIVDGEVTPGTPLWHGFVASVDDSDPLRAGAKADDLGALLARTYLTRGWEVDGDGTAMVDPGFLPAFNAVPGGDRSDIPWTDALGYIHDRTASAFSNWTAFQIVELLLRRAMKSDLLGAPAGATAIPWRLDSASAGDYTPDTQDLHGLTVAAAIDRLINGKRGLAWRITVAEGYAQVLVIDLDAAGTDLDTTADLGWRNARVQRRRDGYDYVLVSGSRPLVGLTLSWTREGTPASLEPDGWDPDTADAVLDAALLAGVAGGAYNAPEWRRFRIRYGWDRLNYLKADVGLRSKLDDGSGNTPINGTRTWQASGPPPTAITIERQLPCAPGFTADATGPRMSPLVFAGSPGAWRDLSQQCRPTPVGNSGNADRSDQGSAVILLGESAEDADALREAVGADGTILVSIGVREWAPLQCAWTADLADWRPLSPRVYHLRQPGMEEWLCLAGTATGIDGDGYLITLGSDLAVRSDVSKLQAIRDQLRVRFGAVVTGATITRDGAILTDWAPGKKLGTLTLADGRAYVVAMPTASVEYDFDTWSTSLRWAPNLDEKPKA